MTTACAICQQSGVEVCASVELGVVVCLGCYLGRSRIEPLAYVPPPPWPARRLPDALDRLEVKLKSHGLSVVYAGVPGVIGSSCPLCPPALGPWGTSYSKTPMKVEHGPGGVHFECVAGCDHDDILKALAQQPVRRREAA